MRILIVCSVLLLLSGCDSGPIQESRYTIPQDKGKSAAEFILKCIENGNPKSDEEPEDWIYICNNMALKLFGEKINGYYYYNGWSQRRTVFFKKCTEAKTEQEKRLCGVE